MKKLLYNLNKYSFLLLILALELSCKQQEKKEVSRVDALPYYQDATFTPYWLTAKDAKSKSFHKIPPFELMNQEGKKVTEKTFEGKLYITDFFFTTCPGICPKMTNNMILLQNEFKEDDSVLLLSHSVTPEIDSVAILKDYANANGVNSNKWHLVTGDRNQIYNLGRKAYFVEEDLGVEKTDDDFLHTENFVLIDENKHIRGIYNGLNKASIQQLIADLKTLQKQN